MRSRVIVAATLFAVLGGLAACTSNTSSSGMGHVSVYLTDAPIDLTGVHAVNVTLSGIVLYPADAGSGDSGGVAMNDGPISVAGDLTVNLLDFQSGQVTLLGTATVPPGNYNRIRLEVVSAELARDEDNDPSTPDVVVPITVPSGKVDVPVPFQLTQDETLSITLDFNAQASVQVNSANGQNAYLLRPVVTVSGMKQNP